MPLETRFIQIIAVGKDLHALDDQGKVWRYYPAREFDNGRVQYATWTALTEHRSDRTKAGRERAARDKHVEPEVPSPDEVPF